MPGQAVHATSDGQAHHRSIDTNGVVDTQSSGGACSPHTERALVSPGGVKSRMTKLSPTSICMAIPGTARPTLRSPSATVNKQMACNGASGNAIEGRSVKELQKEVSEAVVKVKQNGLESKQLSNRCGEDGGNAGMVWRTSLKRRMHEAPQTPARPFRAPRVSGWSQDYQQSHCSGTQSCSPCATGVDDAVDEAEHKKAIRYVCSVCRRFDYKALFDLVVSWT